MGKFRSERRRHSNKTRKFKNTRKVNSVTFKNIPAAILASGDPCSSNSCCAQVSTNNSSTSLSLQVGVNIQNNADKRFTTPNRYNIDPLLTVATTATSPQKIPSYIKYRQLVNRSKEKLRNSAFRDNKFLGKTRNQAIKKGISTNRFSSSQAGGYKLIDASCLQSLIADIAVCKNCKSQKGKLKLMESKCKKKGLSEFLTLQCTNCFEKSSVRTSKNVSTTISAFDINVRSVYASQTVGIGRAGLEKMCTLLDLPQPVTKQPYNDILKNLCKEAMTLAENNMKEGSRRVLEMILRHTPEKIELLEDGKMIANVAVTVDGTWQRRGHCSKIGVVFVLSVLTGEVLDFEVKSLVCHQCLSRKNDDHESDQFKEWFAQHKPNCSINHEGSSDKMEMTGTKDIFLRSIENRNLKYTIFVGDGDSSTYANIAEACKEKYGEGYIVTKEECVGHIQKRLGSALREYKRKKKGMKLADGKSVGGRNRLTDKIVDQMQNYFGQAVRGNVGDLKSMQNDIWAIFKHLIANENESLEEQHSNCPKEADTWCKFWADKNNNTSLYLERNRLESVFLEELRPIFTRLSKEDLLKRCLQGLTQNQNEAINGMLWSRCPKTKFCGKTRVQLATAETVSQFNTGAANKAILMENIGVSVGQNMFVGLHKEDDARSENASRKIAVASRANRQKLRAKRKSKSEVKTTYLAGAFGLTKDVEIDFSVTAPITNKLSKKKPVKAANHLELANEPGITFISDDDVLVCGTRL